MTDVNVAKLAGLSAEGYAALPGSRDFLWQPNLSAIAPPKKERTTEAARVGVTRVIEYYLVSRPCGVWQRIPDRRGQQEVAAERQEREP